MKSYSSREVIKMLIADGWYEVNVVGNHHQYKHPIKKCRQSNSHLTSLSQRCRFGTYHALTEFFLNHHFHPDIIPILKIFLLPP